MDNFNINEKIIFKTFLQSLQFKDGTDREYNNKAIYSYVYHVCIERRVNKGNNTHTYIIYIIFYMLTVN